MADDNAVMSAPDPTSQSVEPGSLTGQWWRHGVVYQVYPRSFADSNGDGVGDLPGAASKFDHLRSLGVDAVWFSPFFRSPMADFGYDVADHCDVDPLFGTLADADKMFAAAHQQGLKMVLDYVPGHSSDQHPWFQAARKAPKGSSERNFYVWSDDPALYSGTRIIFTDTIPSRGALQRCETASLAPLLARAIDRIHRNESVSVLFDPKSTAVDR